MTESEYRNLVLYKLSMSMAKEMLERGIISSDEYDKLDEKMCEKFSIENTSILRNITG